MKNKILLYFLGVFLLLSSFVGYASAQGCVCEEGDDICRAKCENYDPERYNESKGVSEEGCGDLPEGMYCCDGIAANVPCESVVITPEEQECPNGCCGIKLNTNFPIIGNCIETKKGGATDPTNAFPRMIGVLTKIIMSLILVVCFILVIYAGILWSANKPKESKDILKKVAITILLLGFSGVILRLINPNFFG